MGKISLVIPVFNEEDNIAPLHDRIKMVRERIAPHTLEVIFVDDSSSDDSFRKLLEISENDPSVKIIRFAKNFGSHIACYAGILNSSGDACSFIAADMQDPPELLPDLITKWEEGYRIVLGVRDRERVASFFDKVITRFYTFLMRRFALKNMPERSTDVFLIDRKVVDVIKETREKHPNIFGLILWTGFSQIEMPYKKEARRHGQSKWNVSKKIKIFIDSFIEFTYFPLRLISLTGITVACLGFFYAFFLIVRRILTPQPIEGWTSLMVALLVVSGIQMIMIGILGEYLWRSLEESRSRPVFVVSEKVGFKEKD
jgi:dolichol-phosphate mannosyltransferase